jgi:ATP-dependent DNA ligase
MLFFLVLNNRYTCILAQTNYSKHFQYSDILVQDLDLIILGGYYGQGRYSGIVRSFLVGVANLPTNKSGLPSKFFAIVKVSSGLNDAELMMIQEKFRPHWIDTKPIGVSAPKVINPKNLCS